MPRIFRQEVVVTEDAIDEFGHVNNQRYIAWMQEVATAHSAATSAPRLIAESTEASACAWVWPRTVMVRAIQDERVSFSKSS